jgi:hypothetical protein
VGGQPRPRTRPAWGDTLGAARLHKQLWRTYGANIFGRDVGVFGEGGRAGPIAGLTNRTPEAVDLTLVTIGVCGRSQDYGVVGELWHENNNQLIPNRNPEAAGVYGRFTHINEIGVLGENDSEDSVAQPVRCCFLHAPHQLGALAVMLTNHRTTSGPKARPRHRSASGQRAANCCPRLSAGMDNSSSQRAVDGRASPTQDLP